VVQLVPFVSSIVSLAGKASGTSIVLALLVGSFSNVAAFVIVNGVVAVYLDGDERRGLPAAIGALRTAPGRVVGTCSGRSHARSRSCSCSSRASSERRGAFANWSATSSWPTR
jgi:hypothetical protein